jgi:FtsP/CotA-like multicopper oxidase with cupredoxin domain
MSGLSAALSEEETLTVSTITGFVRPSGGQTSPLPGGSVRTFDLTATPTSIHLDQRTTTDAWTYNGTVPGPELRVRQGDLVRVTLHNQLPVGTTIHWHGIELPNGEDGVAGVTQDPIPPGEVATYEFVTAVPGTYWYHPHQHSADQEDKGPLRRAGRRGRRSFRSLPGGRQDAHRRRVVARTAAGAPAARG